MLQSFTHTHTHTHTHQQACRTSPQAVLGALDQLLPPLEAVANKQIKESQVRRTSGEGREIKRMRVLEGTHNRRKGGEGTD
jgi:hypothetical protein